LRQSFRVVSNNESAGIITSTIIIKAKNIAEKIINTGAIMQKDIKSELVDILELVNWTIRHARIKVDTWDRERSLDFIKQSIEKRIKEVEKGN